jgi:hypothetical protein
MLSRSSSQPLGFPISLEPQHPMKSCPTCNRTFEDTFTFCLVDGAILSAPFDPHATLVIPEARQTEAATTGVLKHEETKQEIPPTIATPKPEQKSEELVSTITAPAPAFERAQLATSAKRHVRKSNVLAWIIIVLGSIFIIFFVLWVLTNKNRGTQGLPKKVDINIQSK